MAAERIAKRYAKALFQLSGPESFDSVGSVLSFLAQVWDRVGSFSIACRNPAISEEQKINLCREICQSYSVTYGVAVPDLVDRFLIILVHERRLEEIEAISRSYSVMVKRYRKSLSIDVVTARQVSQEDRASFKEGLVGVLGTGVTVDWSEDPALLGGVVLRAGDRVIDRSVSGLLQQMQVQLLS